MPCFNMHTAQNQPEKDLSADTKTYRLKPVFTVIGSCILSFLFTPATTAGLGTSPERLKNDYQ